ncbi:histone-like nucleoid-structuring protein Lsr2 [Solwaraspora sp. WMMD792]|uniref:Lsr2 family DNA-binding protein n=2 Tax=Solwaraspora sp. WMMD792 TaxID=3016099 RepID=UPI002418063C|nr:histone-like nucleoid-structuring protein Lsr2 [Solwaraspora sp. WMMD792]MDG4768978.1 Lsr2 family protein [Solwaraspora sp. WMMD792]MDG4769003.1 Lsr2 family protein [Solwaraspora sp. WMMD792]
MIAVRTGTVTIGGSRRMVRRGQHTAHQAHPIVAEHPKLWGPLTVDYPAAGGDPAAEVDRVRAYARTVLLMRDHLAAVAATLVEAAVGHRDGLPAEVADAVDRVDEVLRHDPDAYAVGTPPEPGPAGAGQPDPATDDGTRDEAAAAEPAAPDLAGSELTAADRAKIRAWATGQGLPVPRRGKIPADLVDAYRQAHSG